MKKLFGFLLLFFALATLAEAQVSAITILSAPGCSYTSSSVTVTFTVTDSGDFGTVSYDILFSPASSATTAAWSSYLAGNMVCTSRDTGYFFSDQGNPTNTVSKVVSVPHAGFSGNIIVIAQENPIYLSCSDPSTFISFSYPCSPTPTATKTPTFTNTFTNTFTATKTFTATFTNTATATFTATATKTPTCDVLSTPICGNQFTSTFTFTATKTSTPTSTFTATKTFTATSTATSTFTATKTNTFTKTFTSTATNVNTLSPTATPTHVNANSWVAYTPTGTITPPPDGVAYWKPWDGSNPYTPTYTPTPNYTTSPSPTPVAVSFSVNTASSSPQTIAAAVSGCYLTLRRFVVTNTNASTAGAFYISDGTVTLSGPLTIGSGNSGLNISAPTYSAGFNRPLIFFNSGAVTNLMIAGQYSIDLPNQQIRGCQ